MSTFAVDAHSIHYDPEMYPQREAILAWLRAHDLNPDRVFGIRVVGPFIRVVEYVCDEHGQKIAVGDDVVQRVRWVRLREQPPSLEVSS